MQVRGAASGKVGFRVSAQLSASFNYVNAYISLTGFLREISVSNNLLSSGAKVQEWY